MVEEESEVFSVRSTKEKRKEGNLKNRNPSTLSCALAAQWHAEGQSHTTAQGEGNSAALQLRRRLLPLAPGHTLPEKAGETALLQGLAQPPLRRARRQKPFLLHHSVT